MKAHVRFDSEAPGSVRQELADQIELIDESLRKSFSGFAAEAVIPEVQRSLNEIGLTLPADQLQAYARSITEREDFQLVL
jgi:hypothetical protein